MIETEPDTPPTVTVSPKYLPLLEDTESRYFLITGGRNSAKSFTIALLIISLLCDVGHRILYTRYTLVSAEKSIIPEFMEKVRLLGLESEFITTRSSITHRKTGSSILFSGIKTSSGNQTANLKSLNAATVWIVDEADELPNERTFDDIDRSFRKAGIQNRIILIFNKPPGEHWLYDRFYTPYDIPEEFNGQIVLKRSDELNVNVYGRYIHTTYEDNIDNIPLEYLAMIYSMRRENYENYLHVYRGHRAARIDGALWTRDMIEAYRVTSHPELRRIVVGVDPAVTSGATSDLTGIVVAGVGYDSHYYVLDDCSIVASPKIWGESVVSAFNRWQADRVVAETNQGGDLVEANLRNIAPNLPYEGVRATRGKTVRAEPVAALYEMGRVHHVGRLHELERQMIVWTPSDRSPDRMDALVWAITSLMDGQTGNVIASPILSPSNGVRKPNIHFTKSTRPPTFGRGNRL